jgi:DNA replication and repair protein RecF
VYVSHLSLHDFRSYADAEVPLEPGVTSFLGRNGQGKTNLVEAIDYIATLSSHRVASDAPLVRQGAPRAVVRVAVVRDEREALLEVEINPGKANRARINRSPLPRARELVGMVRTVLFSPDDLTLVKGDPSDRRHFLDDLLTLRAPRFAGVRADYDRVLKQRNSLLKTAGAARRGGAASGSARGDSALATLGVWDTHLARTGAELLAARLALVEELRPFLGTAYEAVAGPEAARAPASAGGRTSGSAATVSYKASFDLPGVSPGISPAISPGTPPGQESGPPDRVALEHALLAEVERRRPDELDRGVSLVGPHRDDLTLMLGEMPAKGYASHGECWSFALALRLAAYALLRAQGDDPVLILDDVFAELDTDRRDRLAELVADAEQVLVTAAVPADVPAALKGARIDVAEGRVTRAGG